MCFPDNDIDRGTIRHYAVKNLRARVLDALERHAESVGAVSRDDLAGMEEFHFGGREATRALATASELASGCSVLDVGCGIGGPIRTLAAEFGCHATGLDLTEGFCSVARLLNERVGLCDSIDLVCGSATALPFRDSSFDAVWLQFVVMNIRDKATLAAEIARVLKPGGKLALHEVFSGPTDSITYPVFWADTPSMSFPCSSGEMVGVLYSAGLEQVRFEDVSSEALNWYCDVVEKLKRRGEPPPLNLGLIVPDRAGEKSRNVAANLRAGSICIYRGTFELARRT